MKTIGWTIDEYVCGKFVLNRRIRYRPIKWLPYWSTMYGFERYGDTQEELVVVMNDLIKQESGSRVKFTQRYHIRGQPYISR